MTKEVCPKSEAGSLWGIFKLEMAASRCFAAILIWFVTALASLQAGQAT